ncbi:MAG: Obg family GTPase CgtA, partial [Myxococcales bacterium]
VVKADDGVHGQGKDCYGHAGASRQVRVPLGTVLIDVDTDEVVGELKDVGQEILVARGGHGGRGNKHFSTPVNRAPRHAEPGEPGQRRRLRLELKSMADVGLLGFPNVGKSTFISSVSRAHPKVADYPFTTLEPHLGVVSIGDTRGGLGKSFVVADLPGLVPGASQGHGMGIRFLRHVERTKLLLHLITVTEEEPDRDPIADYHALRKELNEYDSALAMRPEVVAITKADLPFVRDAFSDVARQFAELGIRPLLISAVTHEGLDDLLRTLATQLRDESPSTPAP